MGSKKRLPPEDDDLSDSDLNGQTTPPSHPQSAAPDADEEPSSMLKSRKKRKATMASYSPDPSRLWSKDDELAILKGILDYQNKTGMSYQADRGAFFDYIKNDIDAQFSKDQLLSKMRKMKQRFQHHLVKETCFTNPHDLEVFDLSMKIWGKDKAQVVDVDKDKAEGSKTRSKGKVQRAFVEHEAAGFGNGKEDELPSENVEKHMENESAGKESGEDEPENDDGSAKSDDKRMENENETAGKESGVDEPENDDGSAKGDDKHMENEGIGKETEDELLALKDALEMTMFQNCGKYSQELMLLKLKTIGAKESKELSDEWKALLLEETLLRCKKLFFSAKLAKAVLKDD